MERDDNILVALYRLRLKWVVSILSIMLLGLVSRVVYLCIYQQLFLKNQGNARSVRTTDYKPRGRGVITDRNNEPMAISVPSSAVWVDPKLYKVTELQERMLAELLELPLDRLRSIIDAHKNSRFVYLRRHLSVSKARQVTVLKIPGIYCKKGYKRYYPEGRVLAPVLGVTDVDDSGQEGLELLYDDWLSNHSGKLQVLKDCLGNVVGGVQRLQMPESSHNLQLSIDSRIQRVVFDELTKTVSQFNAESGSVVVLSVKTGEILAMVNVPSYDPNNRAGDLKNLRNRVVTDLFEPGSTAKIFTAAAALHSGKFRSTSVIDTNPGVFYVGGHAIYDALNINNGRLTLSEVLQKSSDIGTAKVALQLPDTLLLDNLRRFGLGAATALGFPGERVGNLPGNLHNRPLVTATLSFGYAFNVTLLQMAQAYAIIANRGVLQPVTLLKQDIVIPSNGQRRIPTNLADELLKILEECVTSKNNHPAKVQGYRVAGKTGTAHLSAGKRGYHRDRYCASFVGIAPVSDPQVVIAIVIRDPKGEHFGSKVAAPLFGRVVDKVLHILNISFDREA